MTFLWLVVGVLATYRVVRMVALEDGPAEVFLTLRTWVFERWGNGWQNRGIGCVLCLSFWFGWGVAGLIPWASWQEYVLLALAVSGGGVGSV